MSDLGSFSQCLVDGDAEALGRARRLRRKAVSASIVLELMLVVVMLLVPLITAGVPPKFEVVTPLPPYPGSRSAEPARPHAASQPTHGGFHLPNPNAPATPTTHRYSAQGSADAPDPLSGDLGPGWPSTGFGIPGATGTTGLNVPPPPSAHAERARKVHIALMEAALIHRVDPDYPNLARQLHLSGEVQVRATISTDGTIKDWNVISGSPIFIASTISAIRQWRYRPTVLDGDPVEVETVITVKFIMN